MAIVKSRNPKTGITYVYSSECYFDEQQNKYRYKRRVIGKLDENGNTVPTSPRGGYHPKKEFDASKIVLNSEPAKRGQKKKESPLKSPDTTEMYNILSRLKESENRNKQLEQKLNVLQKELDDTKKKLNFTCDHLKKIIEEIS